MVAPAVGGGFGAKAGLYVEHIDRRRRRPRARPTREVDRDPVREHDRDDARPRPDPVRRARPEARRHVHRGLRGRIVQRRRCVPDDRRVPAVPHPVDGPGCLSDPEGRDQRQERRHEHDADGRVPGRRPSRGGRVARAHRRHGRGRSSDIDPVELRRQNFLRPGGLPAHDRRPAPTTTSASTRRRSTRRAASPGTSELRREQARTPRARRLEAARHRRVHVRGGDGGRPVPGVRRGRGAQRRHRHRDGRDRRPRPGPRDVRSR